MNANKQKSQKQRAVFDFLVAACEVLDLAIAKYTAASSDDGLACDIAIVGTETVHHVISEQLTHRRGAVFGDEALSQRSEKNLTIRM